MTYRLENFICRALLFESKCFKYKMSGSVETSLQTVKYIRRGRDPPGQKSIYIIPGKINFVHLRQECY